MNKLYIGLKDAYKMEMRTRLAGPDEITWNRLKSNRMVAAKIVLVTRQEVRRDRNEKLGGGQRQAQ